MSAKEPAITLRLTPSASHTMAYLSGAATRHLGDPGTLAIRPSEDGAEVVIVADGGELMAIDNGVGTRFGAARLLRLGFPVGQRVTGRADGPGRVAFPLGAGVPA